MGLVLTAIWNVITLVAQIAFYGAVGTYNRIRPRAQVYLVALTAVTVGSFFVVFVLSVIEMITDWSAFGYFAAFIAVAMTLTLWLLWSPLTILVGMIIQPTLNPLESGRRYMHRLGIVVFAELMLALYAVFVPTHYATWAIPALLIAGAAFGLGAHLWGGGISPRLLVRFALIAVVAITASFFLPKAATSMGGARNEVDCAAASLLRNDFENKRGDPDCVAQQTQSAVQPQQGTTMVVPIPTGGTTAPVTPPVPGGWYYQFAGPSLARAIFADGTTWRFNECVGTRSVRGVRFSGPPGDTVTITWSSTPLSNCP